MKKIRAFLAVELVEGLRERALALVQELAAADADVHWVTPENLHITVKFLGDIDDVESWRVSQALEPIVKRSRRFDLTLGGVGAFPDLERARALWVGVTAGEAPFVELAERIETKMRELAYPGERRRFHPHLTIGRVKGPKGKSSLQQKMQQLARAELGSMKVEAVSLFSSQLRKKGPLYARMATLRLGR
ncbi:MAG: RNA 2',3'-cyclic phosphodiesterase [Planctomycetota bacterium]